MMSQATQAICLTTQTCVATTQLNCQKSNTRMTSEITQVKCFTTQTCVEMRLTQVIVCG